MNRRRMMLMNGQEDDEMKEWKTLDTVVLEEDAKIITVKIPDANEIIVLFWGRENNGDDSISGTGVGSDGLRINNKGVSNYPLTYLRKAGSEYYTKITAEIINGFLDGTISKKGNNELVGFQNLLMNVESIKEISLVTNNLFKTGSKVMVLYR